MAKKLEKLMKDIEKQAVVRQPEIDITSKVIDFYDVVANVEDHRYKSWEHCYAHFKGIADSGRRFNELNETEQKLSKYELGFYLASWGMLRGSAFLLQKDVSVYNGLAEEVLKPEYDLLRDIKGNLEKKEELTTSFETLYTNLRTKLIDIKKTIKDHKDLTPKKIAVLTKEKVTDTLLTKIILGTIGCIPAYDRYFMDGMEIKGFQKKFNSEKTLGNLLDFYKTNQAEIDALAQEFNYTPMKIIDMYFWKIGYDADESKDKEEKE